MAKLQTEKQNTHTQSENMDTSIGKLFNFPKNNLEMSGAVIMR